MKSGNHFSAFFYEREKWKSFATFRVFIFVMTVQKLLTRVTSTYNFNNAKKTRKVEICHNRKPRYLSHKDFTHGGKVSRENVREKLCKKEILREGHFARDFEREESDSSIAYVRFKSPNPCIQSSSIDRFESFDLVNFLESIDSIIQIDSSRYALRKKSISKFFFLVYMRECARTNLSNL